MTPVTNNKHKDLHDEESKGQEAALFSFSSPTEDEMAANHPEESDEPDAADDTEKPSGRTINRGCRFSRNQALAALTAGLALVGTGTLVSVSRAASGKSKTSIDSSLQAAVVQQKAPDGYELLGPGICADALSGNAYPTFRFDGVATAAACAANCECVKDQSPYQFQGMGYAESFQTCHCYVDGPMEACIADFVVSACSAVTVLGPTNTGAGPISDTPFSESEAGLFTCYRVGGGNSKSGKTPKAGKRG